MDTVPILIIVGFVGGVAAIVGGGVEVGGLRIPAIGTLRQRIAVGSLSAVPIIIGVVMWFNPPSQQLEPRRLTETPPSPANEDPRPTTITLVGSVMVPQRLMPDFQEASANYSITAKAGQEQGFVTKLNSSGEFRIYGVPEMDCYTVFWSVSQPTEFVIWPLSHPDVPSGEELRGFHFYRLSDKFFIEKNQMFEAVEQGDFTAADKRFQLMLQMFARLGFSARNNDNNPIVDSIQRWRFTVPQELAKKASTFRNVMGRRRVTDKHIRIERKWRRRMIVEALRQPAPGQQIRDFGRAINSWTAYAREVFSQNQRGWPARSLASRLPPDGEEFLKCGSYANLLHEDIALIQEKLRTSQISEWVGENANRRDQIARLSAGQKRAVGLFSWLLERNPEHVPLNQFVNLLSALHTLVVPPDSIRVRGPVPGGQGTVASR